MSPAVTKTQEIDRLLIFAALVAAEVEAMAAWPEESTETIPFETMRELISQRATEVQS